MSTLTTLVCYKNIGTWCKKTVTTKQKKKTPRKSFIPQKKYRLKKIGSTQTNLSKAFANMTNTRKIGWRSPPPRPTSNSMRKVNHISKWVMEGMQFDFYTGGGGGWIVPWRSPVWRPRWMARNGAHRKLPGIDARAKMLHLGLGLVHALPA